MMYLVDDMIDSGLNGKRWPTNQHREAAIILALANPRVTTMDQLIEVCTAVCNIPDDSIHTLTIKECHEVYNVPYLDGKFEVGV